MRQGELKNFASFGLDMVNQCLWRGAKRIALQPKPFSVLKYLVDNPRRLVTHDELMDALWPETFVQPQVLRTYVLELRKALGDDAGAPRFIETVPKRGYRFVAPITESAAAGPPWATRVSRQACRAAAREVAEIAGREAEIAQLEEEFERLAAGKRRVLLIAGEAGIGKTALVDAFCRRAGSAALAARGQCVLGVGGKEEYYPVMEALGQLCASPDSAAVCRTLARTAPAWLAMLGRGPESTMHTAHATVKETAGEMVPKPAAQERMPGTLCAALEELASARPLILILEDLQWADAATLDLISALARRRAPAMLIVLATYRPGCVGAGHVLKALKHDLAVQRLCTEIALPRLTRAAVMKLLAQELGTTKAPAQLGNFIYEHAEGNPLFSLLLVRHLIAQRQLVREPVLKPAKGIAQWRLTAGFERMEGGLPDELAQMVEIEIERLPQGEQALLEAGSLVDVAFPAWAVAAALARDAVETEEVLDDLARRVYFVERAGQDELPDGSQSGFYVFTHGLYGEVLYQRQSAARRAQRHGRIAERLGELFDGHRSHVAREMAWHYEAAGDWRRSAQARREAARYACERQACAEAAELLEHALRVAEKLPHAEREAETRLINLELATVRENVPSDARDDAAPREAANSAAQRAQKNSTKTFTKV